jgi:hypothetical protein
VFHVERWGSGGALERHLRSNLGGRSSNDGAERSKYGRVAVPGESRVASELWWRP